MGGGFECCDITKSQDGYGLCAFLCVIGGFDAFRALMQRTINQKRHKHIPLPSSVVGPLRPDKVIVYKSITVKATS